MNAFAGARHTLCLLVLAALGAGCAALRPPPRLEPELRQSAPVVAPAGAINGSWPAADWWRAYGDATLDALIERALRTGPSVAEADARVRAATEEVRVAGAALGLSSTASAELTRQRLSDNGMMPPALLGYHWFTQSSIGITVRYQFDWWGKQRAAVESAIDRTRAIAAQRRAAALGLAAAVSTVYFNWQADNARITLLEQAMALHEQLLAIARSRQAAGLDNADLVHDANRQLAALRDRLAAAYGARQLNLVNLAGLLSVDAAALPALTPRLLPRSAATLPADVGTNLLARRPDIQASRWRVEAALRDTDAARARFYPDVSLRALAALSSIELDRLLRFDSGAPQLGLAVDLPLFDAGQRRARHRAAAATLEVAIAAYDGAVITAAREAGSAAAMLLQVQAQRPQREQQLAAARAARHNASARRRGELTHAGPELTARLAELAEQERLLDIDLAAVLADVQLNLVLAGGIAPTEEQP
ncbi:MAG: efflux transporter outer membrane subunit [Gammaproteobacteria bacterium]|nr:efflux transporter outer membrane subunit [Gammaproteobacteria bacterium]